MTERPKSQSALSAIAWMTGSSYVGFAASFVGSVLATRAMGPESYGVYAYIVWLVTLAVGLSTGFFNLAIVRFVAEGVGAGRMDRVNAAVAWFMRLFRLALLVACALLLLTGLLPGIFPKTIAQDLWFYLGFVVLCVVFRASSSIMMAVSKGHSLYYPEAISSSLAGLLSVLAGGVLLWLHQGLHAFMLLYLGISVMLLLVGAHVMRLHGLRHPPHEIEPQERSRMASLLKWNMLIAVVNMLSTKSVDTYLLGLYDLTIYVGYYNIAANMARSGLDLLAAGYSSILLPMISRAGGEGDEGKVQRIFTMSVQIYQTMGILVAGGAWLLAEPAVLAIYGPKFVEVVPALKVMAIVAGLTLPHAALSAVFISTDSQRARLMFIVLSSAISVVTSVAFIPSMGYHGALYSVFFGNMITFVIVAMVAHYSLGFKFPLRHSLSQAMSALIPLAAIYMLAPPSVPLWLAMVEGVGFLLAFFVIGLNIGAWGRVELEMLKATAPRLAMVIQRLTVLR